MKLLLASTIYWLINFMEKSQSINFNFPIETKHLIRLFDNLLFLPWQKIWSQISKKSWNVTLKLNESCAARTMLGAESDCNVRWRWIYPPPRRWIRAASNICTSAPTYESVKNHNENLWMRVNLAHAVMEYPAIQPPPLGIKQRQHREWIDRPRQSAPLTLAISPSHSHLNRKSHFSLPT